MDSKSWIASLRENLQEEDSPLALRNGLWKVKDRKELWEALGTRVFDANLDAFQKCALEVLKEIDPKFELEHDQRYAASIHGKVLKHSKRLRAGIAETLALLGNAGNSLTNSSDEKPRSVPILVIRDLLNNADWKLWATLNDLLPVLAEAAPVEFLSAVENALKETPCPFDTLFAEEETGIFGSNYMTGLLWALEGLAWKEEYLVRVVVILAELDSIDPGGNWGNRPGNSIITILLPWYPQTLAPIDKRITTIKAIKEDFPEVAWKILLKLLPNQHQSSSGAHKPTWILSLPEDYKPEVSNKEYWQQIESYAELAVEMACEDLVKLKELVTNLDNLPKPSFDTILTYLSSSTVNELPEDERLPIWENLTAFAKKHRRFSDAKWSLPSDIVDKIEESAEKLAPSNPKNLHHRLFCGTRFDLYDGEGDWKEQSKRLEDQQTQAIQEILEASSIEGIISFVNTIESSGQAGWALGKIADEEIDKAIIPENLTSDNEAYRNFSNGYVLSRFHQHGWAWVDAVNRDGWNDDQNCKFLSCLPFESETWKRASNWLGDSGKLYWKNTPVNPYQSSADLLDAVDSLIEAGRPCAAIECLYVRLHENFPLDAKRTVRVLLDAVSSDELRSNNDSYHIVDLIRALQNDQEVDQDDLFKVEWAYLRLLEAPNAVRPKLLESRLSTDPAFFCEVIRIIYKSKYEDLREENDDEHMEAIAGQAWHLLHEWKRPPGLQSNGTFLVDEFEAWIASVKKQCEESGHIDIAMTHLGGVLYYCPEDPGGLWIVKEVASALNARDADRMRSGFRTEVYNSRGAHWVDPTGNPEKELAGEWKVKAEAVENEGFARFAGTLKGLADSYDREAERIIDSHKADEDSE